jgi:hypothetical protein
MIIVRYTVKTGQAGPNAELIRAVFAELAREHPPGLRSYDVYADGDRFTHIADGDGLTELPAFRAFVAEHAERCAEPPVVTRVEAIGDYRSA